VVYIIQNDMIYLIVTTFTTGELFVRMQARRTIKWTSAYPCPDVISGSEGWTMATSFTYDFH